MSVIYAPPRAGFAEPTEQRFSLKVPDWRTYRFLSDAFKGRHLRLTYDRGNLELMTISGTHGNCSRLLGRFVFVLAEEFGLTLRSFGDMTCDAEHLDRGLEPDESFYLTNEPLVRHKQDINLDVDPPPDLVLEIDITRSSRIRMPIYAALGVPEVWQYDGEALTIWQRDQEGSYQSAPVSRYFPGLQVSDIALFLEQRTQQDEISLVRAFRAWAQAQRAG